MKTKNTHKKNHEAVDRRDFLKKIWKGLGALAGLEVIALVGAYLFTGERKLETYTPKQLIEAGSPEKFKLNSVTPFRGGRFYLARLEDGGFIALSLRCTHLGCSITWEEDKNRFVCPCHSSSFEITGDVKTPPAPKALDFYPVIIENGIVKVDIGIKKSRSRFSKDQLVYI
jgi:cytochrome b6-f complex iron-sulfur subunit